MVTLLDRTGMPVPLCLQEALKILEGLRAKDKVTEPGMTSDFQKSTGVMIERSALANRSVQTSLSTSQVMMYMATKSQGIIGLERSPPKMRGWMQNLGHARKMRDWSQGLGMGMMINMIGVVRNVIGSTVINIITETMIAIGRMTAETTETIGYARNPVTGERRTMGVPATGCWRELEQLPLLQVLQLKSFAEIAKKNLVRRNGLVGVTAMMWRRTNQADAIETTRKRVGGRDALEITLENLHVMPWKRALSALAPA